MMMKHAPPPPPPPPPPLPPQLSASAVPPAFALLVEATPVFFVSPAMVEGKKRILVVTGKSLFVCTRGTTAKRAEKLDDIEAVVQEGGGRVVVSFSNRAAPVAAVLGDPDRLCSVLAVLRPVVVTVDRPDPYTDETTDRSLHILLEKLLDRLPPAQPAQRHSLTPVTPPARKGVLLSPSAASLGKDGGGGGKRRRAFTVTLGEKTVNGDLFARSPPPPPPAVKKEEDRPGVPPAAYALTGKDHLVVRHGPPTVVTDRRKLSGDIVVYRSKSVGVARVWFTDADKEGKDHHLLHVQRVSHGGGKWGGFVEFTVRATFPFDMDEGRERLTHASPSFVYERIDTKKSKIRGRFAVLGEDEGRESVRRMLDEAAAAAAANLSSGFASSDSSTVTADLGASTVLPSSLKSSFALPGNASTFEEEEAEGDEEESKEATAVEEKEERGGEAPPPEPAAPAEEEESEGVTEGPEAEEGEDEEEEEEEREGPGSPLPFLLDAPEPAGSARSPVTAPDPIPRHLHNAENEVTIFCLPDDPLGFVVHQEKRVLTRVAPGSAADMAGASLFIGREITSINGSAFDDLNAALAERGGGAVVIGFGEQREATPPPHHQHHHPLQHPMELETAEEEPSTASPPASPTHTQGRCIVGRSATTGLLYVGWGSLPQDLRQTMEEVSKGKVPAVHYAGVAMHSVGSFSNTKRRVLVVTQNCAYLFRPQGTVSRYLPLQEITSISIPRGKEEWIGLKSVSCNDLLLRIVAGPKEADHVVDVLRSLASCAPRTVARSATDGRVLPITYGVPDIFAELALSKADWESKPDLPALPVLPDNHCKVVDYRDLGPSRENGYVELVLSSWVPPDPFESLPETASRAARWLTGYGVPEFVFAGACAMGKGVVAMSSEAVYLFWGQRKVRRTGVRVSTVREVLVMEDPAEDAARLAILSSSAGALRRHLVVPHITSNTTINSFISSLESLIPTSQVLTVGTRELTPDEKDACLPYPAEEEEEEEGEGGETAPPAPVKVYVKTAAGSSTMHALHLEPTLGVSYRELQRAVVIVGVDQGSASEKCGLKPNTTIVTVDSAPIHTADDFKAALAAAGNADQTSVMIETIDGVPGSDNPLIGRTKGLPPPPPKPPVPEGVTPITPDAAMALPSSYRDRIRNAVRRTSSHLYFLAAVKKTGAKWVQERVLAVSQSAVYVVLPAGAVKRTIRIANIREFLVGDDCTFALRVPSDYDLLMQFPKGSDAAPRDEALQKLSDVLAVLYHHATSCLLLRSRVSGKPLNRMLTLEKPEWKRKKGGEGGLSPLSPSSPQPQLMETA